MSKRIVTKVILIILATTLFLTAVALVILYFNEVSELNEQKATLQTQLKELPELEKDIFTKCMEGKQGTAQNIAFCQENTQEQMHTLAQDLSNAKKDLDNKKWYEVIQSSL